jgi:hypothetical protein
MARQLSGTVKGWQEGSAEVLASLSDGVSLETIAQGTLDADGRVNLTLPEKVDGHLLLRALDVLPCDEVTVVPNDARVAILFSLTVLQDDQPYAAIAQASSEAATFPLPDSKGDYRVYRWYADQDVTAQGTCESASGGFTHHWSLELKRGWNIVTETIMILSGSAEVRESRTTSLPEGASWYFLDFMMVPQE